MTDLKGIEAFDEVKRLIVIAAHADDLETMCGGTIAKLAGRGVTIFSVNCTLGDIGVQTKDMLRWTLAATRIAEAEAAAEILGIEQTYNLGQPDGELVASLELRAQIARLYRLTQADSLLTFDPYWSGQAHPDHRAAGQAALDAYMPSKMPLYRPEQLNETGADLGRIERVFLFQAAPEPEIYVDITDVYDTKMAACRAHLSQFPQGDESLEWMKELDQGRGKTIEVTYAEAFKQMQVW
ncbi:MAG: PIG-L family deacetylase [Anaerolineae bacterium]|nr:PIG-L family deacetylase [Anaerolineae bacterium]MCB9105023.1 PIG-L family deacetylase [Anaerolineales bacterium]